MPNSEINIIYITVCFKTVFLNRVIKSLNNRAKICPIGAVPCKKPPDFGLNLRIDSWLVNRHNLGIIERIGLALDAFYIIITQHQIRTKSRIIYIKVT